ncbi:MAG: phosphoribosylanthranilate isomerase [Anaerocolumna sp.]
MTKIKICGLKRIEDIHLVNECLPDYIGFVFAGSKRRIDRLTAMELKKELDPSIQAVGVFVNEPIEHIVALCESNCIDIIQLHGGEDNAYIHLLKKKVSTPIIKVIGVEPTMKSEELREHLSYKAYPTEFVMYDAMVKGQHGGSGIAFDHNLLNNQQNAFFLAGGLDANNVTKAIKICNPYCVDVSSGVETDGFKDRLKVRDFILAVRGITKTERK